MLLPGAPSAAPGLAAATGVQCQFLQGGTPTHYNVQVGYNAPAGTAALNAATVQPTVSSDVITGIQWNNQQGTQKGVGGGAWVLYPWELQPGGNTTIGVTTAAPLAVGRGFHLDFSTNGFNTSDFLQCDVTTKEKADLSVEKTLGGGGQGRDGNLFAAGDAGTLYLTVHNKGPARASFLLTDQPPAGVRIDAVNGGALGTPDECVHTSSRLDCRNYIDPGGSRTYQVIVTFTQPAIGEANEATVKSGLNGAVDPDPSNNSARVQYEVYGPLGSQMNGFDPGPPPTFSGTAENLAHAEIGYRLSGAKAPNPALNKLAFVDIAVLSLRPAPGSPQTCRWLANKRAQFRSIPASQGLCSKAIWLRATGTRHWKYALTKSLPAGRYIAYSRAGNKAGAVQNVFSVKRKNRLDFTVR